MRARHRATRNTRHGRRRGIVVLELLLWLPVLLTGLVAVIEFAIMQQVNQQVALASRFGAKIASEVSRSSAASPNLSNVNSSYLKSRIDTLLANAGLTASCEVQLEHNACVDNPSQTDSSTPCNCSATGPATLPAGEPPGPPGEAYVRVTVCVPLDGNVPNCLSTLGFDISGRVSRHSTTYRIETNNTAPSPVMRVATLPAGVAGIVVPASYSTNTSILLTSDGTLDPFSLTFDGFQSSDVETSFPGLTLTWTKTGTPPSGPTTATGFVPSFDVPNTVGNTNVHNVQLTVTDSCGASSTITLQITVQRI